MQRAVRGFLVALGATLAVAGSLFAQSNAGTLFGRVVDEQGSPIGAGTATLSGPGAPRQAAVDAQGHFRFFKIPSGSYSLTVSVPGFTTVTREGIVVSVGRSTQLEIPLRLSAVEAQITVRGEGPLIDPRKVTTGQTFSGEQLTEIPTARDVWALVQQVPGVQLDTINVAGNATADVGGPSVANRGSGNVTYAVDGATITDNTYGFGLSRENGKTNTYFDFGTVEDVEVVTGGSALDQQTSGVTINVVTKRGTNSWKGSARFLYASANWQSDNTPESSTALGLETNRTRFIREYGGELGGPLARDRLWLWAAAGRQDISLSTTTYEEGEVPIPETTILEPWSAKLNVQVSSANSAALYFQRSDREAYGTEAYPDRPYETRVNLVIPTDFYKIEDSHVFSANLFASIFASYQAPDFGYLPIGGLDRDIEFYDGQWHQTFFYGVAKDPQRQANLQVSDFFQTGALAHELKFGFNYRQLVADTTDALPGSQNFGWQGDDDAEANLTRGIQRIYRAEYWTGTLGDTLTSGNLTVSAGVRFDLQRARNLPSRSFANVLFGEPCPTCGEDGFPGLPEVRYHGAPDWQFQFTSWQPRVAVTWALGASKATLLRASYARYADQLGFLPGFVSGVPENNGYRYGWNDLNGDHIVQPDEVDWNDYRGFWSGVDPAVLPDPPNRIAPDFATPMTDEVTAGIDRELGESLAVAGTFSYRNTSRLQMALPTGASPSTWELGGHAAGTITSRGGFTLAFDEPYYLLTLSEPPPGWSAENRPGASQRYFGVDLSVVKRLSNNWMLRGNFGWGSFRQYVTAESIQNANNLWEWGGQNDDGGLATAVSHKYNVWMNGSWQVNLNGLYQGPWGLTFGANFHGRQGYPKPYMVWVFTGDVAGSSWGLLIDEVDTYRYPNVYQLDLRLQKSFKIGPVTVTPAVELFNAANANTLLNSDPLAGWYHGDEDEPWFEPNEGWFDSTIEVQSPRIVRLGVQVSF